MAVGRYTMDAEAGATRRWSLLFERETGALDDDGRPVMEPYDFAGATVALEIRDRSGAALLATGAVTISATPGVLTVELTATQTAALPAVAHYDLLVEYPSTDRARLLQGDVRVSRRITEDV